MTRLIALETTLGLLSNFDRTFFSLENLLIMLK